MTSATTSGSNGAPASGGGPLRLRFVTSAPDVGSLPGSDAEVAVAGRSNVGKSSLLNALAGQRGLAKTSSTPGRTQLLNVFSHEPGGTLVDMPGFGYAKISKADRAAWRHRMDTYLTAREPLRLTLLLVDGEIGPAKADLEILSWLRRNDIEFAIVATKHDKVKSSRRERRKRDLAQECAVASRDVMWVSAERNVGLDRVRQAIREALSGNAD